MSSNGAQGDKLLLLPSTQPCRHFSLAEIQSATKDFDHKLIIGRGGFGKVYKGCINIEETSHLVAVKRLDSKSNHGATEFRAEIHMLSKLRHCHLVSLIGFCDDNKEMILVYDYMPRGTLYDHLHKDETPLNWVHRLKIAIGAGRGLDYLHTGVGIQHGVIHRDVKSSNILLDEYWEAKISDFGLSKIGPTNQMFSFVDASVKGTFGYLDPEYFYTRKLTRKTDVYAFGVVLFELLSGRLAVDERYGEEQCSLVKWAQKCVKERKFDHMVDFNIRGTISPKCLQGFAQTADRCVRSVIKERPTMAEVVVSLQALLELQLRHEENPAEPSGITGFTWKIHKYLFSTTKQNTDQSVNSSSKSSSTNKDGSSHGEKPRQRMDLVITDLKWFTYSELRRATNNFGNDTCLSDKTYVKVYKGLIDKTTYSSSKDNTGLSIAIKRLDRFKLGYGMELNMLKEFNHPNLVKLIGYCLQGILLFLVHEFMPHGNFEDLLNSGAIARLPLVIKVKIAVGIARWIVFLHKTQDQVGESRLDRHNILLDEDFAAKLSGYDVTKLVHGRYTRVNEDHDDGGSKAFQLQTNLFGFTVVFTEVLTGKQIANENEFQKIDDLLYQHGKMSLVHIAKSCFEMCNDVDSESKTIKVLEEYEKYIPTCQNEEFTRAVF